MLTHRHARPTPATTSLIPATILWPSASALHKLKMVHMERYGNGLHDNSNNSVWNVFITKYSKNKIFPLDSFLRPRATGCLWMWIRVKSFLWLIPVAHCLHTGNKGMASMNWVRHGIHYGTLTDSSINISSCCCFFFVNCIPKRISIVND